MLSEPSQQRLRRTSAESPFTAQYHARMLYQDQQPQLRASSPSISETQPHYNWKTPGAVPTPVKPLLPSWQAPQEQFEHAPPLYASFQTAQAKFEHASAPSLPKIKKHRFEHDTTPHALPTMDQWLNSPSPSAAAPVPTRNPGYAASDATSPNLDQWLNGTPTQILSPGRAEHFSYTSPYAAFSIDRQRSAYEPVAAQATKQRSDQLFFASNTPTLQLSFNTSAESTPSWHALTKLETAQHNLANTVSDWPTFARHQTAHHMPGYLIPRQSKLQSTRHALAKLKNARQTTLIGGGLVALLLIALLTQSIISHQTLSTINTASVSNASQLATSAKNSNQQQASATAQPTPTRQTLVQPAQPTQQAASINASQALVRLSQLDRNQYASQSEYDTWAYSACSTTAMAEVFNAYGRHYRITDVLKVESEIGAITPSLGLTSNEGVASTAAKFGFQTNWDSNWTLNQVLSNANAGRPVIVGWPPERYANGHIVVVTGGDATHVYLADSSVWNRRSISRTQFMQWWGGFAAVVTPA